MFIKQAKRKKKKCERLKNKSIYKQYKHGERLVDLVACYGKKKVKRSLKKNGIKIPLNFLK